MRLSLVLAACSAAFLAASAAWAGPALAPPLISALPLATPPIFIGVVAFMATVAAFVLSRPTTLAWSVLHRARAALHTPVVLARMGAVGALAPQTGCPQATSLA